MLFTDDLHMVMELVAGQRCDLGFVAESIPYPGVQLEPIHEAPMRCILPRNHRLAHKPVIRPADLADEAFVSFPRSSDARIAIDRIFATYGVSRRALIEVQLSKAVVALVEHGAGVSLINPIGAHHARELVAVRRFEPPIVTYIHLATLKDFPLSALSSEFLRFMRTNLAEML